MHTEGRTGPELEGSHKSKNRPARLCVGGGCSVPGPCGTVEACDGVTMTLGTGGDVSSVLEIGVDVPMVVVA